MGGTPRARPSMSVSAPLASWPLPRAMVSSSACPSATWQTVMNPLEFAVRQAVARVRLPLIMKSHVKPCSNDAL